FIMKNGEIRTNPKMGDPNIVRPAGGNDPEFPVLFFFDKEGTPMGAITNYACHHDCKAGTEISADYSGVLSGKMKDMLGRNFVNILFQGACGNINHRDPIANIKHNEPNYLRIGKKLAEAEAELYEKAEPFEIDAVFAEKRVIPIPRREIPEEMVEEHRWILENVPNDWYQMDVNKPENQMFKRTHAKRIIELSQSDTLIPVFIQVVRLGELSIYAFPGEIYVEYGLQIKEKSPTKYNMVSGTALKGVKGYIPTPEVYDSTSYAVVLGSCNVVPGAGQMIVDKALEVAKEIEEAL
ncbi:MAG: hypothetical protein IKL80_01525, partial [Clostridia bacterium]|nr:hypothetical protein [Clostridia bacterium]